MGSSVAQIHANVFKTTMWICSLTNSSPLNPVLKLFNHSTYNVFEPLGVDNKGKERPNLATMSELYHAQMWQLIGSRRFSFI